MARIAGIDLPKNKRGEIGLTYIFGIGRSTAQYILEKAGIDLPNQGKLRIPMSTAWETEHRVIVTGKIGRAHV